MMKGGSKNSASNGARSLTPTKAKGHSNSKGSAAAAGGSSRSKVTAKSIHDILAAATASGNENGADRSIEEISTHSSTEGPQDAPPSPPPRPPDLSIFKKAGGPKQPAVKRAVVKPNNGFGSAGRIAIVAIDAHGRKVPVATSRSPQPLQHQQQQQQQERLQGSRVLTT
jgi:hypothetical protein